MQQKYSELSKNIFLFAISGFVPKILSFMLVPIYTNCLTTFEYGISDLINTTVLFMIPIFTLDIQDAVIRYALDPMYQKKDVFSVAIKIILSGSIIVSIITFISSFLDLPGFEKRYLFFFLVMYFVTAVYNTVSLFCRGIDKVQVMVISSILNAVITLLSNIVFLVVFHWGLTGYLFANILGAAVSLVYCFFAAGLYRYIKWKIPSSVRRDMCSYSFPLIFSVIAWWVNNASDRYILTWMSGVAISGIYAIAYKIPTLLTVFQNIFAQAWSISAIKEFDKSDTDGFIGNMYTMMNFTMVIVCSGVMIMDIPLARILYSKDFFEAWKFVPPLLISVVFNAMALFIGSIFTAVKDTKTLSISTSVGAVVNIICNFVCIYWGGAYGAAVATMLGYAVTLMMRRVILRKYINMKVNTKRDLITYVLLVLQMFLAYFCIELFQLQILILLIILMLYYKEIDRIFQWIRRALLKKFIK